MHINYLLVIKLNKEKKAVNFLSFSCPQPLFVVGKRKTPKQTLTWKFKIGGRRNSNRAPSGFQSDVLTTRLLQHDEDNSNLID